MTREFRQYIEQVRDRNDIKEVIGEYLSLNNSNKAICPFHNDSDPSLSINEKGQYWYCFGCKAGGDVFTFVQRINNESFSDALRRLAVRAGIYPYRGNSSDQLEYEQERLTQKILEHTIGYYQCQLPPEVKRYLIEERGLIENTIQIFRIGFADGGLKEYLLEQGYSEQDCLNSKVLKEENGQVCDYFRSRIILPNLSHGQVIHLTGRAWPAGGKPKFLHLPGPRPPYFCPDGLKQKNPVIVEGPFDLYSLHQWGIPAVALLGLSLKKEERDV